MSLPGVLTIAVFTPLLAGLSPVADVGDAILLLFVHLIYWGWRGASS